MGIDVSAYTYVGKWVENAEEYLVEKGILKEGEFEEKYFGDWYETEGALPLQVQNVSCYSDQGYYVGYEVSPSDYKLFDDLKEKFKRITGDEAEVECFNYWH